MAWDDSKQADDLIQSSEWNTMVTDQKGRIVGTSIDEAIADTSANLPTAGTSGRLFFETDTGRVLYDNGSSWVEVGLSESQISLANLESNSHVDLSNINSDDHHIRPSPGTLISEDGSNNFNVQEGSIDHDSLTNFVANEHIDHSTVSISAGTHLTGGGDLTATRTLNVDETGIDATNLDGSAGTSGQFLQTDGTNLSFGDVATKAFEEVADFSSIPSNPETGKGFTTTDKGELFVEVNN